jgi:hypothetical protein
MFGLMGCATSCGRASAQVAAFSASPAERFELFAVSLEVH